MLEINSPEAIERSVLDGLKVLGLDPQHWPAFSYSLLADLKETPLQSSGHPDIRIVVGGQVSKMPTWSDILSEVSAGSSHDIIRRRYLARLHEHTKRNTIIYYSGWLQKTDVFRQMPFGFMLPAKKREINHIGQLKIPSMIAHRIERFSEYEIVMASAEPKPTPNLAPSTRTP